MRKKRLILIVSLSLFLIGFLVILIPTLIDKEEIIESDNDNEEYNPYIKGWEDYQICLSGSDGYYVLNYTMETNWLYLNHFGVHDSDDYPLMYVVPSELSENFTEAWLDYYERREILWERHPILEEVYNIITHPRWHGYDYDFTAPYTDNWFIFLLCHYGGQQIFTYSDAIYNRE